MSVTVLLKFICMRLWHNTVFFFVTVLFCVQCCVLTSHVISVHMICDSFNINACMYCFVVVVFFAFLCLMLESEKQASDNKKLQKNSLWWILCHLLSCCRNQNKNKTAEQTTLVSVLCFSKKHVGHVFCEEEQAILLHRKLHSYVSV